MNALIGLVMVEVLKSLPVVALKQGLMGMHQEESPGHVRSRCNEALILSSPVILNRPYRYRAVPVKIVSCRCRKITAQTHRAFFGGGLSFIVMVLLLLNMVGVLVTSEDSHPAT